MDGAIGKRSLRYWLRYFKYRLKAGNAHGLHSPMVFDLYTDILDEQKTYQAFLPLRKTGIHNPHINLKEAELLFQIIHKFGLKKGLILGSQAEKLAFFLSHISQSMDISTHPNPKEDYRFIHIMEDADLSHLSNISELLHPSKEGLISISQPHLNKKVSTIWKKIIQSKEIQTSIDLWSIGLLFTNRNQRKQHFTLKNKFYS